MIPSSRIIDDAREKIKSVLTTTVEWACKEGITDQYLNLSVDEILSEGTTDIKCPECYKGMLVPPVSNPEYMGCGKCNSTGKIKHSWKVRVVLENGELPEVKEDYPFERLETQRDMLNAKYRQVVE